MKAYQSVKNFFKTLWQDERGQGTAEYILLLVIVVGVVMLFKERIKGLLQGKLTALEGDMSSVNSNMNQ